MEKTQAEIKAENVTQGRLKDAMLNALIEGRGFDAHVLHLRRMGYGENEARFMAWTAGPQAFKEILADYID